MYVINVNINIKTLHVLVDDDVLVNFMTSKI